jgi:hypothetical protein
MGIFRHGFLFCYSYIYIYIYLLAVWDFISRYATLFLTSNTMQITSSIECTLLLVGTQFCVFFVHVLLVKGVIFPGLKTTRFQKGCFLKANHPWLSAPSRFFMFCFTWNMLSFNTKSWGHGESKGSRLVSRFTLYYTSGSAGGRKRIFFLCNFTFWGLYSSASLI